MKGLMLFTIAGVLLSTQLSAQLVIPNAGFEKTDDQSPTKTKYWKVESNDFSCVADNKKPHTGKYSLHITSKTAGNHFFNEEFNFHSSELKKYRIWVAFKTKGLDGKAQFGARVFDSKGGTITKTVFTLTEQKDQDWTMAEGVFVSDENAAKLRVFGNLFGTGEVWFDNVLIAEIPRPTKQPSNEVMLYLHEFFDIVYQNSLITDKNYLAELKAKTLYLCADNIDMKQCHDILQYYTTPLFKDGHSFFTTQQDWKGMNEGGQHPVTGEVHHEMPSGRLLKDDIAYIHIPMFISSDKQLMQQYADQAQRLIADFDHKNVKGYIIDVSDNGGGNSLPMIAGVGPLLGDGVCGYSFSGDGSLKTRIYNEGTVAWDTTINFRKADPYEPKNKNKPIAVIYGPGTASSGEVTAISFIGLPNSRSFGQATYGATTRVDNFELSDGSYLNLASGYDADRNKREYKGPIKPDVATDDNETAIEEAVKWILQYSD